MLRDERTEKPEKKCCEGRNDDWNLECEIAEAMREKGSFGARNGSNELECTWNFGNEMKGNW